MLLLADAAAPAQVGHHQQQSSRHGSTGRGQQQLGSEKQGRSSVLGFAWVQDAVTAAMQGLTQSDGSLRRAASQALAAALVLQEGAASESQPQMLHADLAGVVHPT